MDEDRRRALAVASAIVALTAVLALVATGALQRQPAEASARGLPAGAPATIRGSRVLSIPEAIAVQAKADASVLAVAGWYQQPYPVPCAAPIGPVVPLLDGDCSIGMTWLMRDPEVLVQVTRDASSVGGGSHAPVGPAVNPVFDGVSTDWADPLPENGGSRPTPVVVIGHFDDPRASGCVPADRQLCLDRFVVTTVAWAGGHALP